MYINIIYIIIYYCCYYLTLFINQDNNLESYWNTEEFNLMSTKLKYITQAKKRPPTFVLFTNSPERLKNTSYDRFLVNRIREDFKLQDTIVKILLRKAENPYKDKVEKKHLRNKLKTKNKK